MIQCHYCGKKEVSGFATDDGYSIAYSTRLYFRCKECMGKNV